MSRAESDSGGAPAARRTTPRRAAAALVLAAGTVAGLFVAVALVRAVNEPSRGAGMEEITTSVPAHVPRAACVLSWTPGPPGTTYEIEVTTAAAEAIARASDLTRATYTLDEAALARVPSGAPILWTVTARRPFGRDVRSRTFSTTIVD